MTSKSPSNSSIADTLRTMAKSYAWKDDGDYTQEIAACFAGAAAWEIVQQLIAYEPRDNCVLCWQRRDVWTQKPYEFHSPNCPLMQARTLVHTDR